MEVEGTLGLLAPDPRQRAFGSLDSHSGGIRLGWRPGSRRASRACGGHASQRARRDAEHARLPLSVTASAVTPSPPGKGGLGCARSGGTPLRSPRFAHTCALRHDRERRRPPAEADGGYSCSSGHVPLRKTVPCLPCQSTRSIHPLTGLPPRAQRGRPTGAARPPVDNRHNTSSCSKPPPRGRN